MRSDMAEVIIERPRWNGGRWNVKGRRREARWWQEAPVQEPMSIGRGGKQLNENLAPLRRFLERRVGRPWDDVHREISARLAVRSAVQKHVMDHVKEMVERCPVFIDGTPHHPKAWGPVRSEYWPIGYNRWRRFYVCPRDGVLCMADKKRVRRRDILIPEA